MNDSSLRITASSILSGIIHLESECSFMCAGVAAACSKGQLRAYVEAGLLDTTKNKSKFYRIQIHGAPK